MHVEIEGPEDGLNVLLLHGGTGVGRFHFKQQIPLLTKLGFRSHVVDLPGHGQTKLPPGPFGRCTMVNAVKEYLLQNGAMIVIGFSMGGHTLLGAAEDEALKKHFLGIVLLGISLRENKNLLKWRMQFDPETFPKANPFWAKQLSKVHEPLGGPYAYLDVLERDSSRGLAMTTDTSKIKHLRVPTMVAHGDRDRAIDPDHTIELLELWPHADRFVVPHAGHDAHITRHRVFNPVFEDFLRRHFMDKQGRTIWNQ